jgi:DNA gyrase subunit B
LTLFYRYFTDLIHKGHLYIAQPPLFRVKKGKEIRYAYDEKELEKTLDGLRGVAAEVAKVTDEPEEGENASEAVLENIAVGDEQLKGVTMQRYKGLGEMNPEQLWETTMDPASRMMKQVTIEDAEKADEIFDVLMGSDVVPRKRFIQTHAKKVENLDV